MKGVTFEVIDVSFRRKRSFRCWWPLFIHTPYLHSHFSLRYVQFTRLTDETICNKLFFHTTFQTTNAFKDEKKSFTQILLNGRLTLDNIIEYWCDVMYSSFCRNGSDGTFIKCKAIIWLIRTSSHLHASLLTRGSPWARRQNGNR